MPRKRPRSLDTEVSLQQSLASFSSLSSLSLAPTATYLILLLPLAEAISRRLGFWWTIVVVLKAPSACQTVHSTEFLLTNIIFE